MSSKMYLPELVEKQLVKGEQIIGIWPLGGGITKRYFVATDRRGIICTTGPLEESFIDFTWSSVSSIWGIYGKHGGYIALALASLAIGVFLYTVLITGLFMNISYRFTTPSDIAMWITGLISSFLAVIAITGHEAKKGRRARAALIFVMLTLLISVPQYVWWYTAFFFPPLMSIILGGLAMLITASRIDMTVFHVVGVSRPITVPKFIPRLMTIARARGEGLPSP